MEKYILLKCVCFNITDTYPGVDRLICLYSGGRQKTLVITGSPWASAEQTND